MYTKIREGTRSDSTDLCRTCTRCTIIRGSAESQERRFCRAMDKHLTYLVADCNMYYNKDLPSLEDLQQTAWILETTKARKIGFTPYKEWRARNRDADLIPED